jgi:hypothetical protein
MNRWHLVACIMALGAMMLVPIGAALSQTSGSGYQPAVPAASTITAYGAYPYDTGGGTVAGSAMQGMASVIGAKGDYNLSTSAAAINWTEARKNAIQNQQLYANTYFQMRETNKAYREAERGPRPTEEQLARIARDAAPQPLSSSQMDTVSGRIHWPPALQQESFASQRSELEQLTAAQAAHGSLGMAEQMAARKSIESMFADLRSQIRDIPPQEYVASRNFLQSLIYATTSSHL